MPLSMLFGNTATAGGGGSPSSSFLIVYDAAVGVTTSGSNVTAWANSGTGGSAYNLGSAGASITFVSSVINGLPVVRFPGSVSSVSQGNVITEPASSTMYAVLCRNGDNSGTRVIAIDSAGASQQYFGSAGSYATGLVGGYMDGTNETSNTFYELNNVFQIVALVRNGSTGTFYKNGRALTPTFTKAPGGEAGCTIQVGLGWPGDIAECGLTPTALNSTDLATMFSQLATKYALTLYSGGTAGTAISRAGWTVSASRSGGGAASNAIDNNTTSRWSTGDSIIAGSDYFQIDMGSAQTVGGVQIDDSNYIGDTPKSGNVQYSDNGSTWTTTASWQFTSAPLSIFSLSWTPASHRYWRLLAQDVANGNTINWWSIGEINLYSDCAP